MKSVLLLESLNKGLKTSTPSSTMSINNPFKINQLQVLLSKHAFREQLHQKE